MRSTKQEEVRSRWRGGDEEEMKRKQSGEEEEQEKGGDVEEIKMR